MLKETENYGKKEGINMVDKKKIVIVGAGPGGLVAGMILANGGFDVVVC